MERSLHPRVSEGIRASAQHLRGQNRFGYNPKNPYQPGFSRTLESTKELDISYTLREHFTFANSNPKRRQQEGEWHMPQRAGSAYAPTSNCMH